MAEMTASPPTRRRARISVVHPTPRPMDGWVCKYHLDAECDGLERIAPDDRCAVTMASLYALVRSPQARPCRRCALETVLVGVWHQPVLRQGRPILVTFSSQGVLGERRFGAGGPGAYEVSASGAERLERMAQAVGLEVHQTAVGPVCATVMPTALARVVGRNLRTYVLDRDVDGEAGVDPVALGAFWSIAYETVDAPATLDVPMTWALARAMVR